MSKLAIAFPAERETKHVEARVRDSYWIRWVSRLVLLAATVIFTGISVKYIVNPVGTARDFNIMLSSAAGVTSMRVGFGGFALGFAAITGWGLFSGSRRLFALQSLLSVIAAATAVRILGVFVDGPAAQSFRLLKPELVMLALCLICVISESRHQRRLRAIEQ